MLSNGNSCFSQNFLLLLVITNIHTNKSKPGFISRQKSADSGQKCEDV